LQKIASHMGVKLDPPPRDYWFYSTK
jgi:hypothetical protein